MLFSSIDKNKILICLQITLMANRTTCSITPGRTRKFPRGASNSQTLFLDDGDDFESDENDFDESKLH